MTTPDCKHARHKPQHDEAAMEADGRAEMSVEDFRRKYPRFFGCCEECGERVILYASAGHFILGDW